MKYKNLTKKSSADAHLDNLFLAVSDLFWDMVIEAKISEKEARKLVIRNVNQVISESLSQFRSGKIQ